MGEDTTKYHLVTKDYVSTTQFEGEEILKVDPEGLRLIARQAFHDVAFMLRPEHNEMVAKILNDPEASRNDKAVALTMLLNADVAKNQKLPRYSDRSGQEGPPGMGGQDRRRLPHQRRGGPAARRLRHLYH